MLLRKGEYHPQSLRILVKVKNKIILNESYGKSFRYYDVASVTKIMSTTFLCMELYKEKKLNLNWPLKNYLTQFKNTAVGEILIKDLLRHLSGLVAWKPFFKKVKSKNDLIRLIKKEPVKRGKKKCVYSDLDFILLGWVIEEILEMPLDEASELYIFRPLKMKNTFYTSMKNKKNFAPTERTKKRGLVQGEVFDDNAFSVGGVSGHAGLFSTLEDVSRFGSRLLFLFNKNDPILKLFATRSVKKSEGDWGLGFTLPSRPISTAGTKVSDKAFGHVGFTGTSLWIDPKRQAVITILSNRTFPNRNDNRFKVLRREIHDRIWETIDHGT